MIQQSIETVWPRRYSSTIVLGLAVGSLLSMKRAAVVPVVPVCSEAPGPVLVPLLVGAAPGLAALARRRRPRGPAWGRRRRRRRGSGGACCCCPARGDMRPLYLLLKRKGCPAWEPLAALAARTARGITPFQVLCVFATNGRADGVWRLVD